MGRWTRYEEEAQRLPEGMKRIAYDADTRIYTFRDRDGKLYRSAPGEEYGRLVPVVDTTNASRPYAFDNGNAHKRQYSVDNTFQDILPSNRMTTTRSSVDNKRSPQSPASPRASTDGQRPSPRAQFVKAVRKTTLLQGVVHNLRRSVTSIRRKSISEDYDETDRLLSRCPSVSTTHSGLRKA